MIDPTRLAELLPPFLARQRWFPGGGREPGEVRVARVETLQKDLPAMVWVLADVDDRRYQLVVGLRHPDEHLDFLHANEPAVLGLVDTDLGRLRAYDALLDNTLALALLRIVSDGAEDAAHVRPMGLEQSNTSLVFDERVVLKLFRRLGQGVNPDVEVTSALAAVGVEHVAAPSAVWRDDGVDLAIVQRFLSGAADGWALAVTSLRDMYGSGCPDPAACGGDFAGEASRLGAITARVHLGLAEAFGASPGDPAAWVRGMRAQLERVGAGQPWAAAAAEVFDRLEAEKSVGSAIRVHGDYHLGQVVRADAGWFVLDFEGEPARPLEERRALASPLKDVSGMLRSLHYATQVALHERSAEERPVLEGQALAWERHNREAFLAGYLSTPSIDTLLPPDPASHATVLAAWELDKAIYELAYEQAHRPDWAGIPLAAIGRLLASAAGRSSA